MCGLAGIISFDPRLPIDAKWLKALTESLAHRGPDASGMEQTSLESPYFATGLIHTRLSILDLDARANQPMSDASRRYSIVFNGEIYNFRELRQTVHKALPDFQFRTHCDTEVILAAYQAWGEKCLSRLNGMFAFVIIDHTTHTVFAARDRMGQKPLYLAAIDFDNQPLDLVSKSAVHRPIAAIAFASEIGALLHLPWIKREVCQDSLQQYLLWGYIPSPATIYDGIISLPPGHAMSIVLQQSRIWRYFDANQAEAGLLPGETDIQATRRLVVQSVGRQLVSDVPIGCFLSGGIDSSIIAAAMTQAVGDSRAVHTFSVGFDDPRYDETPYAQAAARHLKTTHQFFRVKPDAVADLPRIARAFGQPFADSSALPTYYLSQATRGQVKVALSGDGGDELFGGYDRYRAMHLSSALSPALAWLLSRPMWQRLPGVHPKSRMARMKRFLRSLQLAPGPRYAQYMQLFDPQQLRALLPAGQSANIDESYLVDQFAQMGAARNDVQRSLALDRVTYLPEDLLTKVDRCSMQHALEVRSPFMDHELVQYAATLSRRNLIGRGGKTLLRKAFEADMPAGHFNRPKMGFAIPIGQWFREGMREMLHDHLLGASSFCSSHFQRATIEQMIREHHEQRQDHTQRLYALLMLELWHSST